MRPRDQRRSVTRCSSVNVTFGATRIDTILLAKNDTDKHNISCSNYEKLHYSLKVVERRADYRRTLDEYGGDWSIARYIEAVETDDESAREAIMQEILDYNREDLEATWEVMEWLRSLA